MKRFALLVSFILVAVLVVPSYAARPTPEPGAPVCAIQGINRADGTVSPLAVSTTYQLISLTGPATFVTAEIRWEILGSNDTANSLRLVIDGKVIVNETIGELNTFAIPGNPFVGVSTGSGYWRISFQQPVVFNSSLVLSATTGPLSNLATITAIVIYGQ